MTHVAQKLRRITRRIINMFVRIGRMLIIEKDLNEVCAENSCLQSLEYKWLNKTDIIEIVSLKHLTAATVENYFDNGGKCLAAYVNYTLAGYVWYHTNTYRWPFFEYSIQCNEKPYIGPDFVSRDYRGMRLHSKLLTMVFRELSSKGYQYALGSVWTNNLPSIKGLIRVGFYPVLSILAIRLMNKLIYKRMIKRNKWPPVKTEIA